LPALSEENTVNLTIFSPTQQLRSLTQ